MDDGNIVRIEAPPTRRMVEIKRFRRPRFQQSPRNIIRIGEAFQLVARSRLGGIGICREKWLAEWQCPSVNEGRNTAKYEIAAKIKVTEKTYDYTRLDNI